MKLTRNHLPHPDNPRWTLCGRSPNQHPVIVSPELHLETCRLCIRAARKRERRSLMNLPRRGRWNGLADGELQEMHRALRSADETISNERAARLLVEIGCELERRGYTLDEVELRWRAA